MTITRLAAVIAAAATIAALALASPARADTIAVPAPPVLLAQDTSPAPATIRASVVGIDASLVGGLSITGHQGKAVTATARGHATRTATAPAGRPAILRSLAPGVRYAISVGGRRVATAVPLGQVGPAAGLRVETTGIPGTVQVSWTHTPSPAEGDAVTFDVTATPLAADGHDGAAIVAATATGTTATLTALDVTARYRFTVTPRNTASSGRPTSATMTRPLAELTGTGTPVPAPIRAEPATPAATPTPAPAPAPAPGPTTKTIYVCPDGYTETNTSLCQTTLAYTYDVLAYTRHWGVTGWHSVEDDYAADMAQSTGTYCPWGGYYVNPGICRGATSHRVDDYGWIKDATPAGYTDTGTTWTKKNPTPTGYADDGTQWVKTTSKIPKTVPA